MHNFIRGSTQTFQIASPQPEVDITLKMSGYKDVSRVRKNIRAIAQNATETFHEIATPTVSYRIIDIESITEQQLTLAGDIYLESSIFDYYFKNATEVIVFALTVGEKPDDQTTAWMDGDRLIDAFFLEYASWTGVELVTKEFVKLLRHWTAEQNLRITRRLGPGYTYPVNKTKVFWELEQQQPLFTAFNDASIPIKLLESCAMLPKMSRSGLYGFIPK